MNKMFFSDDNALVRTLVIGFLAYTILIVVLRTTGKRTLSKLNAFDFVVTVALGSTLATILLSKDVALDQGVLAFLILCGMQFVVTWLSVRSSWVRGIVKSEPRMLMHRGELLPTAMKQERITRDEIEASARSAKIEDLSKVETVVLETDGTMSVIPKQCA